MDFLSAGTKTSGRCREVAVRTVFTNSKHDSGIKINGRRPFHVVPAENFRELRNM